MLGAPVSRSPQPVAAEERVEFPGAQPPARRLDVDSHGLRIAVHEWGESGAPPLLLAHGGFDFARTYDVFAPMLADAGWRVVCWDQRGHGDSEHAALYSWESDVRDALTVLDATGAERLPAVGHSKGAGILKDLMHACPERFTHFANIDGVPSRRPQPDVADHERTQLLAQNLAGWLDHRRAAADKTRRPGSLDELARRRGRMNPRLSTEWLRYLVSVGARQDEQGWRWKIDPALRFGGFGPWQPEWSLELMPELEVPMLALFGTIPEEMGPSITPEAVRPFLPPGTRVAVFEGTGHFIHIEKPREVADLVLEFLGSGKRGS